MARRVSAAVLAVEDLNIKLEKFNPVMEGIEATLVRQTGILTQMLNNQTEQNEIMERREQLEKLGNNNPPPLVRDDKGKETRVTPEKKEKGGGSSFAFIGAGFTRMLSSALLPMLAGGGVIAGIIGKMTGAFDGIQEFIEDFGTGLVSSFLESIKDELPESIQSIIDTALTDSVTGAMKDVLGDFLKHGPFAGIHQSLFGSEDTDGLVSGIMDAIETVKEGGGVGETLKVIGDSVGIGGDKTGDGDTPNGFWERLDKWGSTGFNFGIGGGDLAKRLFPGLGEGGLWGMITNGDAVEQTSKRDPEAVPGLIDLFKRDKEADEDTVMSQPIPRARIPRRSAPAFDYGSDDPVGYLETVPNVTPMTPNQEKLRVVVPDIEGYLKEVPAKPIEPQAPDVAPVVPDRSDGMMDREAPSQGDLLDYLNNASFENTRGKRRGNKIASMSETEAKKMATVAVKGGSTNVRQGDSVNKTTNNYYNSVDPTKNLDPYRMGWG